ncbi:MAG TPA: prepilin-type N-terminal cleavage/methylation domain-containing protein [Thermoanaerobaculia bacterium]
MNDERGTMNGREPAKVHRSSFIVHRSRSRGFTLIELIVVVTIIGILAGIAISNVRFAQTKAREAALKDDLHTLRKSIDDYYADKQKYPDSLQTLKTDRYLRDVPKDPMTGKPDWQEVQASTDPNDPSAEPSTTDNPAGTPGIYDLHSAAPGNGLDGTPYKDW